MNHSTTANTVTRGIRLSAVAALLVLLAGLLAVTQPARANTYVVTNTSNSGPGSLRQALTDANNNPGLDTITFSAATNGVPIVLAGAAGEDANASGDLDILDGGDLTIQGNGVANTIIDGGGIDRVFHVCPGGACTNTVTLTGVTIRNGSVTTGGGIYNEGGTATVDGSTISANTADKGGGIYNLGTLIVQNSSAIGGAGMGNTADYGGGIYNDNSGTTTVDGSTISANTATYGGGIYNRGTLTVRNGSVIGGTGAGNTATDSGGGICNVHGAVTVEGSTISANTATYGGGIYNYASSETTVDGSTVSANTAGDGGGIYNQATLNVQNGSTIGGAGAGNQATGGDGSAGGGIFNATGGTTTVDGSTVSANTANNGGGIYNQATLNVQNGSTIGGAGAGNRGTDNLPVGGGIYNDTGGTTTVDGSTVSANEWVWEGGGIFNLGTLTIQNGSTIGGAGAGNQATDGGGISNRTGGTTTVDGSTVSANTAHGAGIDGFGGGINNGGTLNVTNSTIGGAGAGNQAADYGGGIHNGGTTTVDGSTVSANTAKNGAGISNWGTLNVTNSTIGGPSAANQATIWGGGIYNYAGSTTVTGSCILNNWATINGGGLYNDENSFGATDVTGSSIVGNSAKSFFNNQAAEQTATGNWWGAATGPNTPGADTVDGNVDTSGYLTEPIPGCVFYVYLPLLLK